MHIKQAFQLLQQGQLQEAKDLCETLLRQDPPAARTLILMSAIEQRLGDRPAASRYLLEAAKLKKGDTPALLGIVQALRTIGAVDEAGQLLKQLDANLPEVAISQAQTNWQNGQYEQALAGFESAKNRWPLQPATSLALASALLRLAETDRAKATLLQADRQWPDSDEVKRLLAIAELDQGNPGAALQHLHSGIQVQDVPGPSQPLLSALRVITGQTDEPAVPVDSSTRQGSGSADFIDQSFAWARNQSRKIVWFGTNSGLLNWACRQIPTGFPPHRPVVECGVYHGFSLRLLSDRLQRPIHGFDSFEGLPENWKPGEPAGSYSTRGRLPATAHHVQLHAGWFEDTLPVFASRLETPIALLHVDCDLYSSTQTVLAQLGPCLAPGSILVFDDFLSYQGYEQHEFRAAHEYFAGSTQKFELAAAVLLGRAVAYRLVAP